MIARNLSVRSKNQQESGMIEWMGRMSQLQIFLIWLEEEFGLTAEIRIGILLSLAGLIILWLARAWVIHQLAKRIEDPRSLYFWRKTTQYIYFALSAILLILLWLRNLRDMATYLGLLSAGLAIALKEPLTNIFGWLLLSGVGLLGSAIEFKSGRWREM